MSEKLTQQDRNEILSILTELIKIPSVNTGKDADIPEARIADFITEYLQNIGIKCQTIVTDTGRPNIIGRWPDDTNEKPTLTLNAHIDTVNIDGMVIEPFSADVKDGRIYGRGACDTKASLAIFLWLMKHIPDYKDIIYKRIEFLATCDEENFCGGSRYLVENGYKADEMIIGEPTNCRVGVAHRGLMNINLIAKGTCAHASVPNQGENAIYKITEAITLISKKWIPQLEADKHNLLGRATSAVTIIKGGHRINIIPDRCEATMDTRILPNQSPDELIDYLQKVVGDLCEVQCVAQYPALETDANLPFVRRLLQASKQFTGSDKPVGLPYLTDASQFARTGAKCVVFGPGGIEQAHSANEYLEIDQLYQSAEILLNFILGLRQ